MRRNKKQKKSFVVTLCLLLTMVLGIGYAVLSQQLSINGGLEYGTMKWDVGFKSVTDGGGTINSNPVIASDKKSITITCDIGISTASETCIANAVIANNSTFDVQLEANPTITYDTTYVKSVDAIWTASSNTIGAADKIAAATSKEIKISIVTKELSSDMLPSTSLSVPITITMNWVEKEKISFANDSAIFFGDSVAYGHNTNGNGFGYYIDQKATLASYTNSAVNSATINTQTQGTNNIIEQMNSHKEESYDYVIIEGGFGDLRDEPELGSITSEYKPDNLDTTTFAGAVEYSLYLATTYWENSKIGFIISYYTPNSNLGVREDYDASKEYWDIVKEACEKWNVDYLDFFSGSAEYNGEIKTYNEIFEVENNTYINDGVHPTEDGYKIMVPFIIEWMNKLSVYEKDFEVIYNRVTSFEELVYTADYAIASNGAYRPSSGRAASVGYYLKVNGGETIGLSDTATGVSYALYEFNDAMSSSGGETHKQWLNGNITLNSNTRYVAISFKNSDGSSSFTSEQLSLLPTYLEFK